MYSDGKDEERLEVSVSTTVDEMEDCLSLSPLLQLGDGLFSCSFPFNMVDKYVDETELDKSNSCLNLSFVELLFQTSVIETSRILNSYITMYYNTNTYKNSVVCITIFYDIYF